MSTRILPHAAAIAALLAVVAAWSPTRFDVSDRNLYTGIGQQLIVYDCSDVHCGRVLVAWLVEHLPGPSLLKWKIYAVVANTAAALALARLCLVLGLVPRAAVLASWIYALGFGTFYTLFDSYTSDPLMFFLGPFLTADLLQGRRIRATAVAMVTVFAKEFAAAPLWIVTIWLWLQQRRSDAARVLVAALTVTLVWFALQVSLMVLFNYSYGINPSANLLGGAYLAKWLHDLSPRLAVTMLLTEFGALYVLLPFGWMRASGDLRRLAWSAVPAFFLLIYVQQPDRAMWNFHFVVIPLAALVLVTLPNWFVGLFLLMFGLANARLAAQIAAVPPATVSFLATLVLAAIAGAAGLWKTRATMAPHAGGAV